MSGDGFGIQPSGFVPKLISDIENDISQAIYTNVDANFDLSPDQPFGQLMSATASEAAELWELLGTLYSAINPNNAEGAVLDGVCAYTGTEREEPRYSTAVCAMGLGASATIPAGSTANVSGQPTNTWTLVGPANPTTGLLVSEGPVTSTTAGTYYGFFQATQTGPIVANAGTLTQITTAVSGWNTVTNAAGAVLGANVESDSSLLNRRSEDLAASGASTNDAIRAALLEIQTSAGADAVIQAFVFSNQTDVTDSNGVPPHTTHAVIWDGVVPQATNTQIAQTIWNQLPSGGRTYGSLFGIATDSAGNQQTVYFDRAQAVPVYISLTTTRASNFDSVNGPAAIKAALAAWWATQSNLGVSMIARFIGGAVNDETVQGLEDMPTFYLGTSYSPTTTGNIPCSALQILTLNTGTDGSGNQYILVDGS